MNKKRLIVWNALSTLILILSILIPATSVLATDRHLSDEYIDIIVRYDDDVPDEDELDPAFKNIRTMSLMPVQMMSVPASSIKDITQMEGVRRVTYDQEMTTTQSNQDDFIYSDDWNQDMIGTFDAWEEGYTGRNVRVAVLDTGFYNHEEITYAGGHSIFGDDYDDGPDSWDNDHDGHGTHVAGIIGAHQHTRAQGVAPGVDLFGVKVYHEKDGSSTKASSLLDGIEWAIANQMDIITISSGFSSPSSEIHDLIKAADNQGILIVAASGNTNENKKVIDYPAAYEEVLAVANVDQNQQRAHDSMIASENELAAPGVSILGLRNQPGEYRTMSGTSQATPHVAGIAALLMQKYPNESGRQIRARMTQKARDLGEEGHDPLYGHGLVHFLQEVIEEPEPEEEPIEDEDESVEGEPEEGSDEVTEDTQDPVEEDPAESDVIIEETDNAQDTDARTEQVTESDESEEETTDTDDERDSADEESLDEEETDDLEEDLEDEETLQTTVWIRPYDSNGIATIDDEDILAVADSGVLAISFDSTLAHIQSVSLSADQIDLIRERNITLLIARIDMEWVIPARNLQEGNALLSFESIQSTMDYGDTAKSDLIDFSIEQDGQMITAFPDEMAYRFFTDEPELNEDSLYQWNAAQEEWILLGSTYTNGGVVGNTASVGTLAVFNPNELASAILSGSEDIEPEESEEILPEEDADEEEAESEESSETARAAFGQSEGELPVVLVGAVVILGSVGGGFYFFGGKSKP
ncbi:MAG: S8 family peptidase [Alkalibacterium sp.]|nr:S8 family peptidase [Alkalibacterium sp.]